MAMGATRSRVHDGYALVSDSEDSLLSTEIPRHHMKQQQHTLCRPATSKLRDAVVLIALVAALCVGFASVIWEPHQLAFTFKRHELRHDSSKQVNASAANAAGGEGVVSGKAARLRAHDKSLREQFVFRESDQGTPFDVSLELKTWPKLIEDGGDLVVLWKAASDAVVQKEDLLTLSCGPTNSSGDFLQKKNVTETDATPYSVRFSDLYMMRCNYVVKYFGFQPSDGTFTLLQQLEVGMKDSFNAPKHGHLALTEKDDEMAIMFNSASSRTPQARYGLSVSSLTSHAEGSSTTYKASDMCHAPATTTSQQFFRDPGFMHTVVMTRLQPDEVYYYQYGNDQDGWSHTRSFRSKPKTGAQETANFIAYADMGVDGAPAAQSTAARVFVDVAGGGYDSFLLHFGDISYARGEGSVWDKFFHLIEPYATRTPYMVSIGNHEYDYMSGGDQDPSGAAGPSGHGFHPTWGNYGADSNGECSVPMHHRWHVPATGNSIYWYSFDYAGVHVVQISTEHDWTRGSEQYEWLKRDLEGVDRSVTPWVVLTAHRMMYSTQLGMESDMTVAKHFRSEVEDLLYQNRVNLMLVGHQHAYERSCPVYKGECVDDEKAPVHIVVGSAGFELDTTDFSPQYGNWSVRHANDYGRASAPMSASMDSTQVDAIALVPLARPVSAPQTSLTPLAFNDPLSAISGANGGAHHHRNPLHGRLTPLEKKARDRIRKKEQAKRRLERLQECDTAAKLLQQEKVSSSAWHQKEREEEELILRRLERDAVFPQKVHPAAAGYDFFPRGDAMSISPVFLSYSHALCPVSQLAKSQLRRFGAVVGGGHGGNSSVHHEATLVHPACHGFTMARHNDSTKVSPVFFFTSFTKIPLERVVLEMDTDDESSSDEEEDETEGAGGQDRKAAAVQVLNPIERGKLHALMEARFVSACAGNDRKQMALSSSPPPQACFVCKTASGSPPTIGCPGCFTFSHELHRQVISSQAAQRLKTPKTRRQEQEERVERHRALQRQLVMPSIYRQQQQQEENLTSGTARRKGEEDYYTHVLVDHQAIRKHRLVTNNFVTLHIKTLPVGNILSLRVDIRSSVAHVYELYRANAEQPNRPIYLLLPTAKGLFYLNERIEEATDLRNGLVFGDFYLEDFNLLPLSSGGSSSPSSGSEPTTRGEFMLLSVAVLNNNSTPRLLAQYLTQNFRLLPHEVGDMDRLPIHRAICALPAAVDQDLCQLKLLPHVQRMQAFGLENKRIALAEQQQEREQLLRVAFLEKKQVKLEHKKRQNQLNQMNGKPSAKVRRAMAYFQYVCDSTSWVTTANANANASGNNLKLWEERLEKLWMCFQLLEQWKICKHGRLLEAETTEDTLLLLKLHQQATIEAFDQVLERKSGQGPLLYPMLCLGGAGASSKKLVVKLGVRLGPSASENREYGLLLDLEQDFDALEAVGSAGGALNHDEKQRMKQRGFTKKSLVLLAQEDEQRLANALALCADFEWKAKDSSSREGSSTTATLFASSDLLRSPFNQLRWTRVALAYKQAMRAVASQVAKLEDFNVLARVLQNADAVLSKAQVERWQSEADLFLTTLSAPAAPGALNDSDGRDPLTPGTSSSKTNYLEQAARRILVKKGAALLKRRAQQRKRQIREREEELLRLQKLQEQNELPRLSLVQQLKLAFIKDSAPRIREMLELTPAEKLKLKASQLLDKVAASASSAATAMKKEYKVRAL